MQRFVAGTEYSIDLYVSREGRAKGAIARSRDVVVAGESQVTTTKSYPELERLCMRLSEELGLRGHAVFQAIVDDAGKIHVIECNPRFGGASTLAIAAGLETFRWLLHEASGASLDALPFMRSRVELRQVRFPSDRVFRASGSDHHGL